MIDRRLVCCIFVLACSKGTSETKETPGSGSPENVTAPSKPAEPAPPAEPPRVFAVEGMIARLDGGKLVEVLADPNLTAPFAWLDAHTLVSVQTDAETKLRRYVDGKLVSTTTISAQEWPEPLFVELALTDKGEIWLSKCVKTPGTSECGETRAYLRVLPEPRMPAKVFPPGTARERATNDTSTWPAPSTTPAPKDATIALAKDHVTCKRGDQAVTYPPADTGMFTMTPTAVRWVHDAPAIYEVAVDIKNPADYTNHVRQYFAACEAEPFADFALLGDGAWATRDKEDTWTIHTPAGTTEMLHGRSSIRVSR